MKSILLLSIAATIFVSGAHAEEDPTLARAGQTLAIAAQATGAGLTARQQLVQRDAEQRAEQEADRLIAQRLAGVIAGLRQKYSGERDVTVQKQLDPDSLNYTLTMTWTEETAGDYVNSPFYFVSGNYQRTATYTTKRIVATGNLLSDDAPAVTGPAQVEKTARRENCTDYSGDRFSGPSTDCNPAP